MKVTRSPRNIALAIPDSRLERGMAAKLKSLGHHIIYINNRDLAANENFDLVILDVSFPLINLLSAIQKLREKKEHVRIIYLGTHSNCYYLRQFKQDVVTGYLVRKSSTELETQSTPVSLSEYFKNKSEIAWCIKKVFEDYKYVPRLVKTVDKNEIKFYYEKEDFTSRERLIIEHIYFGKQTKEIAIEMELSPKYIENLKRDIYKKLRIKRIPELIHVIKNTLILYPDLSF